MAAAPVHPAGTAPELAMTRPVRRHRPAVPARRRPASGHPGHDAGEGSAPALRPRQITAEGRAAPAVVGVACAVTLVARPARVLALARRRHARPGRLRGEFAGGRSPAALVAGRVAGDSGKGESPVDGIRRRGAARRRGDPAAGAGAAVALAPARGRAAADGTPRVAGQPRSASPARPTAPVTGIEMISTRKQSRVCDGGGCSLFVLAAERDGLR